MFTNTEVLAQVLISIQRCIQIKQWFWGWPGRLMFWGLSCWIVVSLSKCILKKKHGKPVRLEESGTTRKMLKGSLEVKAEERREHRRNAKWRNRSTSQEETREGGIFAKGKRAFSFFSNKTFYSSSLCGCLWKASSCVGGLSVFLTSRQFPEFHSTGFPFSVRIPANLGGLADWWLVFHELRLGPYSRWNSRVLSHQQSLLLDEYLIQSFPIIPVLEMRQVRLRLNNLLRVK